MQNDIMCQTENYDTISEMYITLKDKLGETSAPKLRMLAIKFDSYRKSNNQYI